MNLFFQQFINNLNKPKNWLLLTNVLLVLFLIIFNNLGIIPLRTGDFVFFAFISLALALYRPGWTFLFFIGSISLENINLAPIEFGITIRPYQFIGALTILALLIRLISGRLNFNLIKMRWYDFLIIAINFGGFFSIINASDKILSLKLTLILATFSALYFLVRNYIQNLEDLKKIIPFFLSSSMAIVFYGIWQNIWFLRGLNGFEAMPGRPNSTFSEADWLGMYLVLVVSVIYILIYYLKNIEHNNLEEKLKIKSSKFKIIIQNSRLIFLFVILTILYVLLILAVSRSAWLGVFVVTFIFIFTIFTELRLHSRYWQWRKTIQIKLVIISALAIAIGSVYFFHLTNFQLGNRVESTGSGMQKITVSCEKNISLPENIEKISELERYDCRHINLEDIEKEKVQGNYVSEIYRKDPNVSIRLQIYQKTWQEIQKHWVLGIGWGNISEILGQDERGTPLNSSNIFLEIWLGSGILGFASLVVMLSYILLRAIKKYYFAKNLQEKIFALFVIISSFGIIVANLFNAGIFLGFFWIWIAVAFTKINKV